MTPDPTAIIQDAVALWHTRDGCTVRDCLHEAFRNAGVDPAPDDIERALGTKGHRTLYLMWSDSVGWTRRFMLHNYRMALNAAGSHTVDLTHVPPSVQSASIAPPDRGTAIHRVISFYDL